MRRIRDEVLLHLTGARRHRVSTSMLGSHWICAVYAAGTANRTIRLIALKRQMSSNARSRRILLPLGVGLARRRGVAVCNSRVETGGASTSIRHKFEKLSRSLDNYLRWQECRCDSAVMVEGGCDPPAALPLRFQMRPAGIFLRWRDEAVHTGSNCRVVTMWQRRGHPGQSADCLRKRSARLERGGVYKLLP